MAIQSTTAALPRRAPRYRPAGSREPSHGDDPLLSRRADSRAQTSGGPSAGGGPISVPRHLRLAPEVTPARLAAASGDLAALHATPPATGDAKPAVLLVPGYTGSKEDFLHLLPLLARAGHPATAIDLRGQHESGGPEDVAAYTVEALAADVTSLLGQLEQGAPAHLVGHSFGGIVCRSAVLAGAPVRSLTLLASGPAALGGNRGALIELMRPLLADGGVPAVWAASEAMDATAPGAELVPADVRDFLRRRFLASPAAALLGMGEAVVTAPDRVDQLRDSAVPVLVLHGDADDAWPPAEQAGMAARLGARHVELPAVGHSPAVEAVEATAAAMVEFWAAVDGRPA
jgi:pimeloyl-ACP methyl ester carboxylesterase